MFIVVSVILHFLIGEVKKVVGWVHVLVKVSLMVWINAPTIHSGEVRVLQVYLTRSGVRGRPSMH